MSLDPDCIKVHELYAMAKRPPLETMTVAEAREGYRRGTTILASDPVDVGEVRDLSAEGPGGKIPLRMYRPKGAYAKAALPALVIIAAFTGGWVLNMRTVMINTISEDYVAVAHAKGLKDRRVMTRYAGRNAILPPLNGFAALFASAVGGLVFIEYIFSYPGVGYTLQQAVLGNDYPLAQAILVVLSICVILANFIMDLLNLILDPRLRAS